MFRPLREWPRVSQNISEIASIRPAPYCGIDIEWGIKDQIPTIIGVSDGTTTVSAPYYEAKPYVQELVARFPTARWVLHNGLQSDIPILKADNVHIPPAQVDDTILWHWLTGMALCKSSKKLDDDEGERRGRGFMNIYCFVSQYTDIPFWKTCLKDACVDRPCPEHSPFFYNSIDALAPVLAMPGVLQRARMLGVDKLYPLHRDVSLVLSAMHDRGVLINVPYVETLRGDFETSRAELRAGFTFNPDSPKQVLSHFAAKGIKLATTEEQTVRDACEESDDDELATLLEYKELGKGPDRWFAPRLWNHEKHRWKGYVDENSRIHCNLNFFTSTGRFACVTKGTPIEVVRDVSKYPKGVPIEDVKPGDLAYCYDDNGELQLRKVLQSRQTGVRKVIRLQWMGGGRHNKGYVDLTADHKVLLTSGEWREAGLLKKNDSVMALSRTLTLKYARLHIPGGIEIREHRFIFGKVHGWMPEHVHHINKVKLDNRVENLEGLTNSVHVALHGRDISPSTRAKRAARMHCFWKNNRTEMMEAVWKGTSKRKLNLTREWIETELLAAQGQPTVVCNRHGIDYETFQKYMAEHEISYLDTKRQYNSRSELITFDLIQRGRKVHEEQDADVARQYVGLGWARWREFQEKHGFVPYNHLIQSIEELPDEVPVYDLEIEEYHNYIAGGICVHNCSGPNLQNVGKRRKDRKTGESIGKKVRRAMIAPEGQYLFRADLKNAENRVFLHLAGHTDIPDIDFHAQMRDAIGIQETDPFAQALGGAREAAKSVTHAGSYLEGLQLIERAQLRSPRIMNEVAKGARVVYPNWIVFGKVVTFTGVNLSKRAFGEASYENRKRALDVQEGYFAAFPGIRKLQQRITTQVEQERCVRPPTGYVLLSYGQEHDRLKTAAAMWGSNPVSHITKFALINAEQHPHLTPVLQVHDELLFYVDRRHDPTAVSRWIRECMEIELPDGSIPGLRVPVDVSYGENWSDQREIPASTKVTLCA